LQVREWLIVSEGNVRQLRVLHLVSSGGVSGPMQQSLFMPLLTKMPKQRIKAQVVSMAPGFAASMALRQSGIPVHDIALSRRRFAWSAAKELLDVARAFRPDVVQAWGHTAQLAALLLRSRCDWTPKVVWSIADTAPLPKNTGLLDRQKLGLTARLSVKPDRLVFTSEAAASLHRRAGYPESGHLVVSPGVDPMRFKPDPAARRKMREQLGLGSDAVIVGMIAPFQPEHDHATLIKSLGELIKTEPKLCVVLAGHGVQKGNGPLMALVGGGALGTRTHLLGDWSDTASFFNACDIACSSSLTDTARMTLVMAMLCGVPCVATGMGAQGEVIGQFGVAIEPGSPQAFIRGITRVMQLPQERRTFMTKGARKHALTHFVQVRSLQKYLQLYFDLVGRQSLAVEEVPTPDIDVAIPESPPEPFLSKDKKRVRTADAVSMHDLSDPDSLETQVPAATFEYQRKPEPPQPEPVAAVSLASEGDVLEYFEASLARSGTSGGSPMAERARGVAEEMGDLLAPEVLQEPAPQVSASASNVAASPSQPDGTLQLELIEDPPPQSKSANG